jgi:endonuclease I
MKQFYALLIALILTSTVCAQIPSGYYDYATGTGYILKTQLKKIINNVDDPEISNTIEEEHQDQGYNAMDGFIASYDKDNYYEAGSNTILDIYSENPNGSDPYNYTPISDECGNYSSEGDCYNKEHVIPKSVFNDASPMYSDAHELLPTDGRVNGFRSNYPYGVVDDNQLVSQSGISNPTQNGSKVGNNLNSGYSAGYTGIVFEPIDEFKGDVARIYFYFATRYEDQVSAWSSFDMFDGSSDKVFTDTFLSILVTWHLNDPVSQKEIDRNNNIFYNHQNNRNPFIDHPEFVTQIWNVTSDTEAPSDPTNLITLNPTDTSIDLSWTASTDNVAVSSYDIYIDAVYAFNSSTTNTTVSGLIPDTQYCFTVKAKDASGNESGFSNESCETTTNNGSSEGDVDLFFSEYIEGSGSNKVLEIANYTGNTVSLSTYTLKLSTNGNASWNTTYTFPANTSITNQDVFVVANGGSTVCTSEYDDLNNAITSFNGNDAIGLFKNNVLIDILGDFNSSSVYAENTTLVRKQEVDRPSTIFDLNEWTSFGSNNCDNLGSHTQTLNVDSFTSESIKFYPNPVELKLHIDLGSSDTPTEIEIYNILGKRVLQQTLYSSTNVDLKELQSGVYILKLTQGATTVSKRLIKN